jgi:hypothetical protein
MRRVLLVLLGFGVFAGYGSAIASARWHHRMHNGGGCEGRWSQRGYYDNNRDDDRTVAAPAVAPTPQAQVINVPQAAPAPAPAQQLPAQQIFLIMPGAQGPAAAAPQVITVPVPTTAAVPPAPAPATP